MEVKRDMSPEEKIKEYVNLVETAEKRGDTLNAADNYLKLGKTYNETGDSENAKKAFEHAMERFEKHRNYNMASKAAEMAGYTKIAKIFRKLANLPFGGRFYIDETTEVLRKELKKLKLEKIDL